MSFGVQVQVSSGTFKTRWSPPWRTPTPDSISSSGWKYISATTVARSAQLHDAWNSRHTRGAREQFGASSWKATLLRAVPWMPARPDAFVPFPVAQLIIEYAIPDSQAELLDRLELDLLVHSDVCQVARARRASARVASAVERAR